MPHVQPPDEDNETDVRCPKPHLSLSLSLHAVTRKARGPKELVDATRQPKNCIPKRGAGAIRILTSRHFRAFVFFVVVVFFSTFFRPPFCSTKGERPEITKL